MITFLNNQYIGSHKELFTLTSPSIAEPCVSSTIG